MREFIYWLTGIFASIILSYVTYKHVKKIKNIKVRQSADSMADVTGADFKLQDGKYLHLKNVDINQDARVMRNVKGMSFEASGTQTARLQGVKIRQPRVELTISEDPDVRVEINKRSS